MASDAAVTAVLLEYAQEKVSVVDADGTFRYVNDAARQILGFDPEMMVGTTAWEYIHPDDRQAVRETFDRVVSSEEYSEVTGTHRHETVDDGWVWLESRVSNLATDAVGGYVVSSRDVTDRVETERRHETAERRLRELTDRASEVLWMFDGSFSELLFCNNRCEEVYGVSVSELKSDPTLLLDCVHPDDVPAVEAAMDRLVDGDPVDVEYRVNPDTEYGTWVWVQGEPIVEDGEVVRIVGFARDVTDRKQRERQLAVMDTLLRHNIRNDMNAILSNAELIEEFPDERPQERAAIIRRVGDRLVETVEKERRIINLLEDPDRPRPVAVAGAARRAVETVRERHPNATIDTDLQQATAVALQQLELVVAELLGNALRHAETDAPTTTLSVTAVDDAVEIRVRDHCPPIPAHEYRVLTGEHEMTATYHSSGLGLWLVYWIVDLSDGTIDFERTGDGNVATVRLRRA